MEEELKNKIRELYQQLKEEEKGRYVPGTGFRYFLPPDSSSYYMIASKILDCARTLCSISGKYQINELAHTITKDVECIRDYKFEYDRNSNKPKQKSLDGLVCMMRNTTCHIYRDFVAYLE